MRQTLIIILISVFNLNVSSQEDFSLKELINEKNKLQGTVEHGYILSKKNERKPGYIIMADDKRNSRYIYFQRYKNANPEYLDAGDIIGYGYDRIQYDLKVVENDSVFMKKLSYKEPYLYYYKDDGNKYFYLVKGKEMNLLPEEKDRLVVELKEVFNTCKEADDQMDKAIYNEQRLTNLLEYYNTCMNKKLPYFKIGLVAGMKMNNIQFKETSFQSFGYSSPLVIVSNFSFNNDVSYKIGIYLDALIFDDKFNWTFHPELEYSRFNYDFSGNFQILNSALYPDLVNGKFELDINYVDLDLFVRYNTLRKNTSFYMDFGPVLSYNIPKARINSTEIDFDFNKFMVGAGLNVGIEMPVFKDYNLISGIDANYLFPTGSDEKTKFSTWNLGVFIGVGL